MNFKFCSLTSGSSGNCQYIETKNTRILIDNGLSGKRVEELLKKIDVSPDTLDAIFVTHEHIDHVKGVGVMSRRYDLPIYANANTWSGMEKRIGKIKEHNIKVFSTEDYLDIKDLEINPIHIFHDANEPVGYILRNGGVKISVMTDTGWVSDSMKAKIKGSDLYLIESNHDTNMLKTGSYPWPLKQRISSTRGHLSNDDAGMVLCETLSASGEIVLLGHLSKDNNKPELAHQTVKNHLNLRGVDTEKDIKLDMTYRDSSTKVYCL